MSVRTLALADAQPGWFTQRLREILVLVGRNLLHIAREPMQLSDVTLQPILFTLLFIFVFGSGIPIPGGSYTDFALAGLLAMNLITSSNGTAVGLSTDLNTGLIDRFRALPMWRPSILIARSITDLLSALICTTIVVVAGLVVGWRPTTGVLSVAAGLGIALLFTYAICWTFGCVGLVARNIEAAMSIGFIVLFPMAFVSNAMVPTQGMPAWLRLIADWNPVSSVTAACRQLFGNPNPSALIHDWPMQHPVTAALLWAVALLVICVPLATVLFRHRTAD
ncbi:MAG: ABC transporter permease [Candidatus Dormibacteria bacterium]